MNIALLMSDYHMLRLVELLLQYEQYTVTCFGKIESLEASSKPFDLLILDPGRLAAAYRTLKRLESWRPETRRILLTPGYENVKLARDYGFYMLFWPCSRQLFLVAVRNQNPFSKEQLSYGT